MLQRWLLEQQRRVSFQYSLVYSRKTYYGNDSFICYKNFQFFILLRRGIIYDISQVLHHLHAFTKFIFQLRPIRQWGFFPMFRHLSYRFLIKTFSTISSVLDLEIRYRNRSPMPHGCFSITQQVKSTIVGIILLWHRRVYDSWKSQLWLSLFLLSKLFQQKVADIRGDLHCICSHGIQRENGRTTS